MAAADTPNHLRPQDWDELLLGQASEQASAHLDVCGQCRSFPIASAATHLQRQAYCHPQHLCHGLGSRCRFSFLRRPLVTAERFAYTCRTRRSCRPMPSMLTPNHERLVAAVLGSHVPAPASVEDHRVPENDERRAVLAPARPRVWHRPCMVVGRAHPRRHHDERSPPAHRSHRARFRAASVPALLSCDPQQAPDDVSRMRFRAPAGEGLVTTHPDARSSRQRLRSLP